MLKPDFDKLSFLAFFQKKKKTLVDSLSMYLYFKATIG